MSDTEVGGIQTPRKTLPRSYPSVSYGSSGGRKELRGPLRLRRSQGKTTPNGVSTVKQCRDPLRFPTHLLLSNIRPSTLCVQSKTGGSNTEPCASSCDVITTDVRYAPEETHVTQNSVYVLEWAEFYFQTLSILWRRNQLVCDGRWKQK